MNKSGIGAFSDGVIAIIITIMVLISGSFRARTWPPSMPRSSSAT